MAAKLYWQSWSEIPIRWPRKDERRVPEHWKRFGSRISLLTHSPRLAASPANACLNFLYSVLESESNLAASAMGLLPEIGLLHTDTPNRNSLSCDLMEVCRPNVDAFVLNWLQSEPLCKSDFWEDRNGNCRLVSALAIKLAQTSQTWRRLVAPVAEYVAQELWSSVSKPTSTANVARQLIATRLTQRNKREAKGAPSLPSSIRAPHRDNLCRGCGKTIQDGRTNCARCAVGDATKNMLDAGRIGRQTANGPDAQLKRANTQRKNAFAQHAWKPSDQPAWLTEKFYAEKIQSLLASLSPSVIARHIFVSRWYAGRIREGYRPHPRHWQALAELGWCLTNASHAVGC